MSLLSDLGTKVGAEFKSHRLRLEALEASGGEATSKYPTSIILGNQDWTDLLDSVTGCSYSLSDRGLYVAGASIWKILNIKFPIDPNKTYRYTIRVKKISGDGRFYAGVASYDTNGNLLQTDGASSYNYGTANSITVPAGSTQTFTGVYSGYNSTTEADRNKFDPEASYFSPMFICNYQGSGDSVIESLEIETVSDYALPSEGKMIQMVYKKITNQLHQTNSTTWHDLTAGNHSINRNITTANTTTMKITYMIPTYLSGGAGGWGFKLFRSFDNTNWTEIAMPADGWGLGGYGGNTADLSTIIVMDPQTTTNQTVYYKAQVKVWNTNDTLYANGYSGYSKEGLITIEEIING